MAHNLGFRNTPHALVRELAQRAADRSVAYVGPVIDDGNGPGRLFVMSGGAEPIRAWLEVAESSLAQLAELGDTLRRAFVDVQIFESNVALAEAALHR